MMNQSILRRFYIGRLPLPNCQCKSLENSGDKIDGVQDSRNLKHASAIFRFIDRVGNASPRDVQRGLLLPKTITLRHLDSLTNTGIISRIGKTTAVRHQLKTHQPIASS